MTLVIPGRPIAKGRPHFANGHAYTPKATRDRELEIRQIAFIVGLRPLKGPVRLRARFYQATRHRLDVDNALKLLADSLQPPKGVPAGRGNAYHDDSQIVSMHGEKFYDRENPRTEVEIEAVT